jgi:uncharacterized membrane protein
MKHLIAICVESILVILLFLSTSAMDSENMVVPTVGLFISIFGLLIASRLEERNDRSKRCL